MRWYVNAKDHAIYINDLRDEHDENLLHGFTIKYKGIEWAFYFGHSCVAGKDGNVGPHYHLQVKKGESIVHDFSNRHIELSDFELFLLDIDTKKNPAFIRRDIMGAGMQEVMDVMSPEDMVKHMQITDDNSKAQFRVSTMITASDGHLISGDQIANLAEESKRTKTPVSQLLGGLNNIKTSVIVEPGPGVPEAFHRVRHRHSKKRKAN